MTPYAGSLPVLFHRSHLLSSMFLVPDNLLGRQRFLCDEQIRDRILTIVLFGSKLDHNGDFNICSAWQKKNQIESMVRNKQQEWRHQKGTRCDPSFCSSHATNLLLTLYYFFN